MTAYVALLRAVNVGGTGKLPMAELQAMAEAEGFERAKTYIASGNLVFRSDLSEPEVKRALERRLEAYAGKPVGVLIRTAREMADTAARNPFADKPDNRVVALFVDDPMPDDALDAARHVKGEEMRLGERVIYVFYSEGQADSRLVIPAAAKGTGRNMNTVSKLAEMAAAIS